MILTTRSRLATCAVACVFVACGGAVPPPGGPSPTTDTTEAPSAGEGSEQVAAEAAEPATEGSAVTPAPSRDPVLAATSLPAGLENMSDTEQAALEKACKPLMDAIVKVANRDRERKDRTEAAMHALQSPPAVAGVDMTRCTSFVRNQLATYRARSIESEAVINLKRIVFGLADATQADPPRLCPSAPPVPANLDAVRGGLHQEPPSGWGAEGWTCVRFQLGGAPQRFQYELVTDAKAGTYRIIARGFPVEGHGPEELFLQGKTLDGSVSPSSEVMRK